MFQAVGVIQQSLKRVVYYLLRTMLERVAYMFDDVCATFFRWKNVLISIKHFLLAYNKINVEACQCCIAKTNQSEGPSLQSENVEQSKTDEVEIVTNVTCFQQCYMRIQHC